MMRISIVTGVIGAFVVLSVCPGSPQPEPEVSRLRRTWRWLRSTG